VIFMWPIGLLALAAVPAAVLIAMWRARRRELPVSSITLWDRLAEQVSQTGAPHRRLIDVSLLLAGLFALLAGLAVAGPMMMVTSGGTSRTLVLIVDRSASMQMAESGTTRWKLAQTEMARLTAALDPADRVYLFASPADDRLRLEPLTPAAAIDVLRALEPTDLEGDILSDTAAALAAAHSLRPFQAVVCTDTPELIPSGIAAVGVGGPAGNLYFTRFTATGNAVALGIGNVGDAREATVRLALDDAPPVEKTAALPAGGEATVLFEQIAVGQVQQLRAEIAADDALAADNVFHAARQPLRRIRVLLTGRDDRFIERALAVHPAVEISHGPEPDGAEALEAFDLLICNGIVPKQPVSRPTVVIDPPESFDSIRVGGTVKAPQVTSLAPDALLADCGLAGIGIENSRRLQTDAEELAASDETPLIVRSGPLLCVAFSLSRENTDWPIKPGFPIFWAKVIEQVAPPAAGLAYRRIGDTVQLHATHSASVLRMLSPRVREIGRYNAGSHAFRPQHAGLYELSGGNDSTPAAFNILDSAESATQGSKRPFEPGMIEASGRTNAARRFSLAGILLTTALASAMAHWFVKR